MKKIPITNVIFLIVAAIFVLGPLLIHLIVEDLYNGEPPDSFYGTLIIILLLIGGSPGVVGIIKRETPALYIFRTIKGMPAVILSIIWVTAWYGLLIYIVYEMIF